MTLTLPDDLQNVTNLFNLTIELCTLFCQST